MTATLLPLAAVPTGAANPYRVDKIGELSSGDIDQWEISSAALPGQRADALCTASSRNPGDPQIFLTWAAYGGQRTLTCPGSLLGQAGCNSAGTTLPLESTCPSRFAADSNDNISMRLRDGRILTVFQTLERYCPGGLVHPRMPFAEAMGDGDGNEDELCAEDNADGVGNNNGACEGPETCTENCAELTAFDAGNSGASCNPGDTCAPYYEQVLYYTRISDDCGVSWDPSRLRATEVVYADNTPFATLDLSLNQVGPVFAMDRVDGYADPFTDNVFLTAQVGVWDWVYRAMFFHASAPPGATTVDWRLLFDDEVSAPTVITSMEHLGGVSRVYWFNCAGRQPKLYFADDPWTRPPGALPTVVDLGQALSTVEGRPVAEYACQILPGGQEGNAFPVRNILNQLGIARVWTDGVDDVVRVAYTQLIEVDGIEYQSVRIVDVRVTDVPPFTSVTAATNRLLDAASSRQPADRASVLWPHILQTDQVTTQDPAAATQVLRWTEVIPGGTNFDRFASWDPTKSWVGSTECPQWGDCPRSMLWNPDYDLDNWPCIGECSPGDYQYGAFIQVVDECTHDFFAPWGRWTDTNGDSVLDRKRTHAAIVRNTTDEEAPVFDSRAPDETVECDAIPPSPPLTASDACDPMPDVEPRPPIRWDGACPDNYTLTRSWTATDNVGNQSSESQVLTVEDTTSPALASVPPDETVQCDAVPAPAPVSATDNCDPNPSLTFGETRIDGHCPFDYELIREWTAEDRCANDTKGLQSVTVQDTTPPTVTSGASDLYCLWPPNHKYVCFGKDAFAPTIADNCSANNTWVFTGCASDQSDDAGGDGKTRDDCVVSTDGQTFCVRAERDGSVPAGRRYAVSVAATDECGNTGAPATIGFVHVPHHGGAGRCIQ